MKIPVVYVNFSDEADGTHPWWDMALISDIVNSKVWKPAQGYDFAVFDEALSRDKISDTEPQLIAVPFPGEVVIVPARHNADKLREIQEYIDPLDWCILILCGDEERSFDYKQLKHPNMKIWLMQPRLDDEADFYLGSGYTPALRETIRLFSMGGNNTVDKDTVKDIDWFFAGQINHPRRELAAGILERMITREDIRGDLVKSEGFTQGIDQPVYYGKLLRSKAIPSPSGIQSPDSFRVYEALESGAVPVADDISTVLVHETGYWDKVFNGQGVPFKVYSNAEDLEGYITDVVREYPAYNNRVFAWWQNYKKFMVDTLNEQIHELSGVPYDAGYIRNKITIIILTSPIPSHPSTEIIDQTIRDLRARLPNCEILIGIDGVRKEQEHRRADYEKYKQHLLWKCNYEWRNVLPVLFEEHMHQSAMTRKLLQMVRTPTILFVEHDTAITPDYEFEWPQLVKAIETGQANVIRFSHEADILPEHKHLMMSGREKINGIPMIKTMQWSQRPHLASTFFYKQMIDEFFTEESRTMIEDVVHGSVQIDCQDNGIMGWYKWRLWIYAPEGNIKRSYTTDGRKDDPKFDMIF